MDATLIIGSLAACLTTLAFLPQVAQAHRSRRTKDLSLLMFLILAAGLVLWIVYGLRTRSLPIITANCVTLVMNAYLIFLKVKYG